MISEFEYGEKPSHCYSFKLTFSEESDSEPASDSDAEYSLSDDSLGSGDSPNEESDGGDIDVIESHIENDFACVPSAFAVGRYVLNKD